MSMKPLRPCRHPGCMELVQDGYCAAHQPVRRPDVRSPDAQSWRRLYHTKLWRDILRPTQLAKAPWCAACAAKGIRTRATDVDHIVDHKGDLQLFADPSNLQSLCHACHSAKTARSGGNFCRKKEK